MQYHLRLAVLLGVVASAVALDGCRGSDSGVTGAAGSAPTGAAGTGQAGSGEAGVGAAGTGGDVDAGAPDGAAGTGAAGTGAAVTFTKEALLGAFGTCAATTSDTFHERAVALDTAVKALVASPGAPAQAAAREAFQQAMTTWETLDVLQYGPAAASLVTGGQNLRDYIYGWPQFSRCLVEEGILTKVYASPSFGALPYRQRGLATLDYLLFYEGADSACPAGSPETAMWTALSADERAARKRAYAAATTADLVKNATTLDDTWDPAKGNFVETMRKAGPGNAVYMTAQHALYTVGLALIYLDSTAKDKKLGDPLSAMCASATCLESPFSARAKENLRINLAAARMLLEGCEAGYAGLGFDDLLASINQAPLAATLHAQLLAAQAALDAIEETDLGQAFAQDVASVGVLRQKFADLSTTLKTTFFMVLGFDKSGDGTDNDT